MGLLDSFKKKAIARIPMKVCMMGPRAVGKTTILTAIFNDTQENIGATTNLILKAEGDTNAELIDRKHQLNDVFVNQRQVTDRPAAGLGASATVNTFDFAFGLKGKEPRIDLEIKDFPGEYVQSRPEEVQQFIKDSSAVFVAIDTPHLMEENGLFCSVKNKPEIITDFFKNALTQIKGERLVLLVPLKCERYFFERRMDEVLSRVEEVYSDLISVFKENSKIACAVTPILTLGGVELDHIKKNGNIVPTNIEGCPEEVIYRFRKENPKYNPVFCVQPLYYMLSFLAAQYGREKKNRGFLDKLFTVIYDLFDDDEDLFDEILRMEKYRKTDIPGYRVECGSDLFKYCK